MDLKGRKVGEVGMRKIPARIKKVLAGRTKAAQKFMELDSELTQWMEEHGIDLSHWELRNHLHGGCISVIEPRVSEETILDFLNRWSPLLKEKGAVK